MIRNMCMEAVVTLLWQEMLIVCSTMIVMYSIWSFFSSNMMLKFLPKLMANSKRVLYLPHTHPLLVRVRLLASTTQEWASCYNGVDETLMEWYPFNITICLFLYIFLRVGIVEKITSNISSIVVTKRFFTSSCRHLV